MVGLLFQLLIGAIILSTLIFYASLCIASRHEDIAAKNEAELQSIRTVPPRVTSQANGSVGTTSANCASVGTTSITPTSMSSP